MGSHAAGIGQCGAPGDPLAVANASLQATAQATQTTLDLGRQFLGGLGINLGGPAASAPSAATTGASRIPRANARQAVEYVIRRAGSQMGVPYSWGGGSLQGPSKGVDSGPTLSASTAQVWCGMPSPGSAC